MTSGRWLGTGMRATHGTTWWQLSAASNPQLCYWSTSSGVKRIRVANACESFLNVGTKTCCGLLLPQFFCKTSRCFVAPLNSLLRRRQQWPMPYLITEISCCHLNSEVSVTRGSKPHFDFLDIVLSIPPLLATYRQIDRRTDIFREAKGNRNVRVRQTPYPQLTPTGPLWRQPMLKRCLSQIQV